MSEIITTHLTSDFGPHCEQMDAILVNASFDDKLGVYVATDSEVDELVYIAPNLHRYCAICMNWAFLVQGTDTYRVYMVPQSTGMPTNMAEGVNFATAMSQYELWLPTATQEKADIYVVLADLGTEWINEDERAEEGTDFGFQETDA